MKAEEGKLFAEYLQWSKAEQLEGGYCAWNEAGDQVLPEEMKFDSDWNWLMDVVTKTESLGYDVNITGITCSVNRLLERDEPIVRWVCGNREDKIGLVCLTMVHFINWYNENVI